MVDEAQSALRVLPEQDREWIFARTPSLYILPLQTNERR
jgi:hypothetical protein